MRNGYSTAISDFIESSYLELNTEFHLKFNFSDFQKNMHLFGERLIPFGRNKSALFKSESLPITNGNKT